MGRVAGVIDDPPGFPYAPPGVDVLDRGKLTSNNVVGVVAQEQEMDSFNLVNEAREAEFQMSK